MPGAPALRVDLEWEPSASRDKINLIIKGGEFFKQAAEDEHPTLGRT
jgi:hypothetical protein